MIEMKDLSFGYRNRPLLFEGFELSIPEGAIYGLLGKNGAGKTTLLRLIAGLLFPQSGQIEVFGYRPADRLPAFLADLFFIPEELYLPPITIGNYQRIYAPFYPKFDHTAFHDYLREFDLDPAWRFSNISYGQQKKTILSFGLATNTSLLIMDEPTNGLDVPSKAQFRRLIAGAITAERTFIISTHQVRDMAHLIDPIIILDRGEIVFQESLQSIADTIRFQLQFAAPAEHEALYAERVPGGYIALRENDGENDFEDEVDLEVLFNAVTANTRQFANLFRKEIKHEHE